jgi:hypothetical protein
MTSIIMQINGPQCFLDPLDISTFNGVCVWGGGGGGGGGRSKKWFSPTSVPPNMAHPQHFIPPPPPISSYHLPPPPTPKSTQSTTQYHSPHPTTVTLLLPSICPILHTYYPIKTLLITINHLVTTLCHK